MSYIIKGDLLLSIIGNYTKFYKMFIFKLNNWNNNKSNKDNFQLTHFTVVGTYLNQKIIN